MMLANVGGCGHVQDVTRFDLAASLQCECVCVRVCVCVCRSVYVHNFCITGNAYMFGFVQHVGLCWKLTQLLHSNHTVSPHYLQFHSMAVLQSTPATSLYHFLRLAFLNFLSLSVCPLCCTDYRVNVFMVRLSKVLILATYFIDTARLKRYDLH